MNDIIDKYNKVAEVYAKSRLGTEDIQALKKFASLLKPGDKVLDAGCAAGRDTRILKDMGLDVTGTDLAENLLKIAKRANPDIQFTLADIRQLPFADHTFNGMWVCAVLHHVQKTEMPQAIREFKRVLTSGGILYVHTKAGTGTLRTNEATVQGETREFELVTAKELDAMLTAAGYTKLSLTGRPSRTRPGVSWVTATYKAS